MLCVEEQTMTMIQFGEKLIVQSFTIAGIPDDWMLDMLHVLSDLMASAGIRLYLKQAIPSGRIAINAMG